MTISQKYTLPSQVTQGYSHVQRTATGLLHAIAFTQKLVQMFRGVDLRIGLLAVRHNFPQ